MKLSYVALVSLMAAPLAFAQTMTIDASQTAPPPRTGFLNLGGRSSTGHDLAVNSRYLTLDGKPFYPVMGEFHFSRFPPQYWEQEILKMKAGGINTVATYVFWIHHEEIEGGFDWTGQRDLRHFVELCARHHMYVYVRPGPWAHGETRNGGFPDWLMKLPHLRTNDPAYLAHVTTFFAEVSKQLLGLLWKQGGPVIGFQLENEYPNSGKGAGAEHLLELKHIAQAQGLDAPLYSVTGWPTLDFPPREVLPVSGGYPDGFWYGSRKNLPPSPTYLFNFNRELGDMGATVPAKDPTGRVDLNNDPYFAAEEAGGMEAAYHRRPLMAAADITALTVTGVGSGINLYGYYMFHGGANPAGKLTTLQESQATAYPNDLPTFNYDFQAPIGEYGQLHDSYRKLKSIHLFLNAFGSDLATMSAYRATPSPSSAADASVPRVAVRANGQQGFAFLNNYVRQLAMPARPGFQLHVKLPEGEVAIPAAPMTLPANTSAIWPINLPMAGATLTYSTAQLLTRVETSAGTTFVFFAVRGIAPEFRFAAGSLRHAPAALLRHPRPGAANAIHLTTSGGARITILLLTAQEAENLYVVRAGTQDVLAITSAGLTYDAAADRLTLTSTDPGALHVQTYPALPGRAPIRRVAAWSLYSKDRAAVTIPVTLTQTHQPGAVPPVAMGPFFDWRKTSVAHIPPQSAFDNAAVWDFTLPATLPAGVPDLWLTLHYTGDIAQLHRANIPVDDDFYNGLPWQIGLKRYLPTTRSMQIAILPLRSDAPIYLDPSIPLPKTGQAATINQIRILPEYEAIF